ncbi:hypothetical protein SDC9_57303 [bioreactor metagenome]|jgi:hypothetical protein|uniref:Secretion system C-terminal sorting domain-containing protein n=2 Tax=root TaxID=1 RepID=A0A644X481_9ZZZZ
MRDLVQHDITGKTNNMQMKKTLLLLSAIIAIFGSSSGQSYEYDCVINFESNPCWGIYKIDTSYSMSNWHICKPNKQTFESAFSAPLAILTDSTGPYRVNDTSSFTVQLTDHFQCWCMPMIGAFYKMESDSLTDFGMIELSTDNGLSWNNILSNDIIPDGFWLTPKPIFTGRISEWTEFFAMLPNVENIDTLLFRFTFISDSVQTGKAGWILDDIKLLIHTEGAPEIVIRNEVSAFPNPANNTIIISHAAFQNGLSISVYNIQGQLLYNHPMQQAKTEIDMSQFENGVYFIRVFGVNTNVVKKIVKR